MATTRKTTTRKKRVAKKKTVRRKAPKNAISLGADPGKVGEVAAIAATMASVDAGVEPPVIGSRVNIWKQDPTVKALSFRNAYLHTNIEEGPGDSQIKTSIDGFPPVEPDANGDFLFDPSSEQAFDAVHTYAVIRQVLTLYQRSLKEKMKWQWNTGGNTDPISVQPHAGETANAFYSRNAKALKFFFFRPPGAGVDAPFVFTCRSLDIVSHEAGHAVLDSFQPGWITSFHPQTGGLHESFGDLTSIFLVLSQLDQVDFIISSTKADLHQKNILSSVAEEFGSALGRPLGLRNADNNLKLSEVTNEVHNISRVFTGGIYDALADAFTASRQPRNRDDAEVLHEVGKKMANLVLRGIRKAPSSNATYADVAKKMIAIAKAESAEYPNYDVFIQNQFELREVLGGTAVAGPAASGFAPSRRGCCGTMQRSEFT